MRNNGNYHNSICGCHNTPCPSSEHRKGLLTSPSAQQREAGTVTSFVPTRQEPGTEQLTCPIQDMPEGKPGSRATFIVYLGKWTDLFCLGHGLRMGPRLASNSAPLQRWGKVCATLPAP